MDPALVAAFDLQAYLRRIGLQDAAPGDLVADDLSTLQRLMAAQSRMIPFENLNVVVGQTVSMAPADVERKLVGSMRGGYCFEVNTLLRLALLSLGFARVEPTLCRVRWNKPPDEIIAPSHVFLRVWCSDGKRYLADVGFSGVNVPAPVALDTEEPQQLGQLRVVPFHKAGCTASLERLDSQGVWRSCYVFDPDFDTVPADMELCNWGACTLPTARFTKELFAHIFAGEQHTEAHFVRERASAWNKNGDASCCGDGIAFMVASVGDNAGRQARPRTCAPSPRNIVARCARVGLRVG
jgi:N-hydroxyarylamine O-acetyltransferase